MRREHTTFTAQVNVFLRWKFARVGLSHARGCTASLDLPKGLRKLVRNLMSAHGRELTIELGFPFWTPKAGALYTELLSFRLYSAPTVNG